MGVINRKAKINMDWSCKNSHQLLAGVFVRFSCIHLHIERPITIMCFYLLQKYPCHQHDP